jgi:hypothetical protein
MAGSPIRWLGLRDNCGLGSAAVARALIGGRKYLRVAALLVPLASMLGQNIGFDERSEAHQIPSKPASSLVGTVILFRNLDQTEPRLSVQLVNQGTEDIVVPIATKINESGVPERLRIYLTTVDGAKVKLELFGETDSGQPPPTQIGLRAGVRFMLTIPIDKYHLKDRQERLDSFLARDCELATELNTEEAICTQDKDSGSVGSCWRGRIRFSGMPFTNNTLLTTSNDALWILSSLKSIQAVNVGMDSIDFFKLFMAENPFEKHGRFLLRECPSLKVNVEFGASGSEHRAARITSVSQPFLDWEIDR